MNRVFSALLCASLTIFACGSQESPNNESVSQVPAENTGFVAACQPCAAIDNGNMPIAIDDTHIKFDAVSGNSYLGIDTGISDIAGKNNTGLGFQVLSSNLSGVGNTAFGYHALRLSTGDVNTAFGRFVLAKNTTGYENTGVGSDALGNNTSGSDNSAFGIGALGANSTGRNNASVGHSSMQNNGSGKFNTAMGDVAMGSNYDGSFNSCFGSACMAGVNGDYNAALGYMAGFYNGSDGFGLVSKNTFLGSATLFTTNHIENSTAVGYGATVTKSNQVVLGNDQVVETVFHGLLVNMSGAQVCMSDGTGCPNTATATAQPVWVNNCAEDTDCECPVGLHQNGSKFHRDQVTGAFTMSIRCN